MSAKHNLGPRLTAEQKRQAIELARNGLDATAIGNQLGVDPRRVNGVIVTARNRGLLSGGPSKPDETMSPPPPIPETPMGDQSLPASSTAPVHHSPPTATVQPPPQPQQHIHQQPAPPSAATIPDGFSGGRPVLGSSGGGFTGPTTQVRWTVERIVPPDGLLGTHYGPFGPEELGQIYGSGTYRITKQEPGKPVAIEYIQKIGESYGEPKYPNNAAPRAYSSATRRPFFSRTPVGWPYERTASEGEEDHGFRNRPALSPPWQYPYNHDRSLYEFAKHSTSDSQGAISKAIEMTERMYERSLAQIEAARKGGPDTYITKFFEAQQELMNRRLEEERYREEERRRAEEEKWERQRKEERERWERQQNEAREAHQRELQRIKAEAEARLAEMRAAAEEREKRAEADRKYLLELEDKRLALLRQEAEIAQKRLEAELSRTREEMKALQERTAQELSETREATQRVIEESRQALEKRLQQEREALEREHKLRERALDREHELQKQQLDMHKQLLEQQSGDQLFQTINTVIKEFSKGLEKVVDLKKLEAMTPEAQAAAVARGTVDGNVVIAQASSQSTFKDQQLQQMTVQQSHQAVSTSQREAVSAVPSGNGHTASAATINGFQDELESNIREALQKPMFRGVIREWAAHVEAGNDPTMFANIFLEFMRDPVRHDVRQGCSVFAGFMSIRPWPKMFEFLKPHLDPDVIAIFDRPEAADFYEAFRAMVAYQVREYWQQCLIAAKASEEARRSAAQAHQQQGRFPVESQALDHAESQPQTQRSPVVPQREDLGTQTSST